MHPSIPFATHDALLLVDVQNDFFPGGSLAIDHSEKIIPQINLCIYQAQTASVPIIASRDWHPPQHCSFKSEQGPWPVHCVAGSSGAELHPQLQLPATALIVNKATHPQQEQYSAAYAQLNLQPQTTLLQWLQQHAIQRVWLAGVALEYCVKQTALDLQAAGINCYIHFPATCAMLPCTKTTKAALIAAGVTIHE